MNKKGHIPRVLFLLVLSLFIIEYLEPSAVGIRASNLPSSSEPTSPQNPPKDNPVSVPNFLLNTPHAMLKVDSFRVDEKFPEYFLPLLNKTLLEIIFSKEIPHPPA